MVNPAPEKLDRLLRTREAAKFVGLSPRTMESYRHNGGGPPFVKVRDYAVRYVLRDLLYQPQVYLNRNGRPDWDALATC